MPPKAEQIVHVFKDWLDRFAELDEWEQEQLIGEAEWYALEMKVLQVLYGVPPDDRQKDGDAKD